MKILLCVKRLLVFLGLLSSLVVASPAENAQIAARAPEQVKEKSWMDIFDQVKGSIVQIVVYKQAYDFIKPFRDGDFGESAGSGFVATAQGDIFTNWHVARNGARIFIQHPLVWKERFEVEFVGASPQNDWAHLRVKSDELVRLNALLPDKALKPLALGNSDNLRIGTELMLLGYPLGQEELKYANGPVSGHSSTNSSQGECFTATNLALHGSSGGPCVDKNGEVVGILCAGQSDGSGSGAINYILPISRLKVVQGMLENGKILQETFWGISTSPTMIALYNYLQCPEKEGGVHICSIATNSLGQKAGLEKDDILVAVNGCSVDRFGYCSVSWTEYKVKISDVLTRAAYGDVVDFVVYRKGQKVVCSVIKEEYIPTVYKYYHMPFDKEPTYDVFGGFVVMEMTENHAKMLLEALVRVAKKNQDVVKEFIASSGMVEYLSNKKITKPALIISHIFPESSIAQELAGDYDGNAFVIVKKVNNIPVSTIEEFRKAALESVKTGLFIIEKYDGSYFAETLETIIEEEPMLIKRYRYSVSPICQAMIDVKNAGKASGQA